MTIFFPPAPRHIGAVNWLGLWTMISKETERFLKIYRQTIIAPVVSIMLYFTIFAFAFGGNNRMMGDVPYLNFIAPGLIMMAIAQNTFSDVAAGIVISKVQGNIVDLLMTPMSPFELTVGYVLGGVIHGIVIGVVSVLCMGFFTDMHMHHPFFVIYHGLMGSLMLALIGLIGGIWAEKFDHMAAIDNFVILPATFLSGTFYSADRLPQNWQFLCHLNPFFYMIDGFRYGFIGVSDGTLLVGVFVMMIVNIVLLWLSWYLIATGYKLKA